MGYKRLDYDDFYENNLDKALEVILERKIDEALEFIAEKFEDEVNEYISELYADVEADYGDYLHDLRRDEKLLGDD